MQCVILAGGLGTRMQPLTTKVPKTLIPVAEKPFAHYQLTWLAQHGVTEVVYSIAVMGDLIRDYVGNGGQWNLSVNYVEDGDQLVGTGGALRRVYDAGFLDDAFLVLYGDSFLPFDFQPMFQAFGNQARPAMMSVYRNLGQFDAGNVRFEAGIVRLYSKGKSTGTRNVNKSDLPYIDYGMSALRKSVVAEMIGSGEKTDLADVYHRLSVQNKLAGWEVKQRFYEIGSPVGLRDFEGWVAEHPVGSWANL
jgi:MurNAc alpha-1-phosphate uridylyltransferase